MLTTRAPTNHPWILRNNNESWKKYIIKIYLFDNMLKACALLVSIIVQLLAKSPIGNEQRFNITNAMAYQHSTNYAYKGKARI